MQEGVGQAIRLFHRTVANIPAYRHFLARHRFTHKTVNDIDDFKKIPIADKKSYLYQYPLKKLFPHEHFPPMVYASSGSSGHPTFWFRGDKQETVGAEIHERIFQDVFKIPKQESTLVVICFSMGVWVAGNYTLAVCRLLNKNGYRISVATPGIEMEDILNTLRDVAPQFKHLVLAGYPPFIMDVVTKAAAKKIKIASSVKVLTAGDKFTEEWRDSLMGLLRVKDPLSFAVSIYGSADAGVLGYETPLSIFLRREATHNKDLRAALFGHEPELPAFVQYDPRYIFFEEVGGELLFTTETATPLIRYNIHDVGSIMPYKSVEVVMKNFNVFEKARRLDLLRWQLPCIVKRGRNDVAVTFYALNIYPENIKACLDDRRTAKVVSGQFFAFNKNVDHNKKQELCIDIELAKGMKPNDKNLQLIKRSIVENLISLNIEYRKLYSAIKDSAFPHLRLLPFGSFSSGRHGARGLLMSGGKKAKMVQ